MQAGQRCDEIIRLIDQALAGSGTESGWPVSVVESRADNADFHRTDHRTKQRRRWETS
jgi:hypothetical protein